MALLVDGSLVVLYFVGIVWLGLYMGRREESLHDFALGGRRVPWWAVMASIIAAETSAATFLGTPGEGYATRSLSYVQLIAGLILGRVLVGYCFLEPYYRYKVYTVYDYLGVRFGPLSRCYVSALFLVMRTLASGTRMFVPSLVMVLAWQLYAGAGSGPLSYQLVPTLPPYVVAIALTTILTCVYTAIGGIKAVIWTDLVQATLMFGSALISIVSLLYHVGGDSWNLFDGLRALVQHVPEMKQPAGYFLLGWEPALVDGWMRDHGLQAMAAWDYVELVLASPYTLFSALIASTVINMAAFGTDQDMVQRLLTAETYQKSRRSLIAAAVMDLPIAAAFTFIGILLVAFYERHPPATKIATADVFGNYILTVMPMGVRGLVLAGVFATAMGSLSAALNALATSLTNDWYIPYFARGRSEKHHVAAARVFTGVFAVLMILIATAFAYAKVKDPDVRIIPVVLGIAGFILGPMLGVFLVGMFTRSRGSDRGNVLAVTCGLIATVYFGGLHVDLAALVGWPELAAPPPIKIAFTWFALLGAAVVFLVGILFRTSPEVLAAARRKAEEARHDDRPLALREAAT